MHTDLDPSLFQISICSNVCWRGKRRWLQLCWTGLLPAGKSRITATAHGRGLILAILTLIHHIGQCKLGTNAPILILVCSHFYHVSKCSRHTVKKIRPCVWLTKRVQWLSLRLFTSSFFPASLPLERRSWAYSVFVNSN